MTRDEEEAVQSFRMAGQIAMHRRFSSCATVCILQTSFCAYDETGSNCRRRDFNVRSVCMVSTLIFCMLRLFMRGSNGCLPICIRARHNQSRQGQADAHQFGSQGLNIRAIPISAMFGDGLSARIHAQPRGYRTPFENIPRKLSEGRSPIECRSRRKYEALLR